MKKTIKETIHWHPVEIKYPENLKRVLLHTNDGIIIGFWNKNERKWVAECNGSGGYIILNSDTHVYYWSNFPNGVDIFKIYETT
jgi:hypothetical protein